MSTMYAVNGKVINAQEPLPIPVNLMTKLWENPNPSAAFSAQDITLASDDYDFLLLICRFSTSYDRELSFIVEKGKNEFINTGSTGSGGAIGIWRDFNRVNDTKYSVSNAYYAMGANAQTNNDTNLIPQRIYGFKKQVPLQDGGGTAIAANVIYDNTESEMPATNLQEAIDMIWAIVGTPDGSTVLPIDDVMLLQKCAGIIAPSYTTLGGLISDSLTWSKVISNENAMDYMLRSTGFISTICANQTAMQTIGQVNMASNKLLDGSMDWRTGIVTSNYRSYMLNTYAPVMTSNNTPSGECICSSEYNSSYKAYFAFDSDTSNYWNNNQSEYGKTNTSWLGYDFKKDVKVYGAAYKPRYSASISSEEYRFIARNSGSDSWRVISQDYSDIPSSAKYITFDTDVYNTVGQQFAVRGSHHEGSLIYFMINQLQFYGRVDV